MFDSRKELMEKLKLGEDSFFECKEVRCSGHEMKVPRRDVLADELAAFANSRGGLLVMGVEDGTGEVIGIPVDCLESAERVVRDVCQDSIEPSIAPVIERMLLPTATGGEAAVIRVDVPRSLFVHRSPSGYLHRVGSSKRGMSSEYLARLFQQRSQTGVIRFDEQTIANATLDDLEIDLWHRFRTARSGPSREEVLTKLHMARDEGEASTKPTVAGVLMASTDPRKWLPNAFIQAVAYRGTNIRAERDDPYQLDAADISGPLDRQAFDACRFVARNMRVAAFKDQGRIDRPQFDMGAVFEAIVNAVAHRDYSIHNAKIRLRLFDDRLELYSPGGIPNTLAVEDLAHTQSTRNEVVASLLARCSVPADVPGLVTDRRTMMDRRGEGVPLILDRSSQLSGTEPKYRLIGNAELLLTIFAAPNGIR